MSRYQQNLNNGSLISSAFNSLNKVSFSTNIQLQWARQYIPGATTVAAIMEFTPAGGGLNVRLPDCLLQAEGASIVIKNMTGSSFNLNYFDGTLFTAIAGGSLTFVWMDSNTTQNGSWQIGPFGGGTSGVISVGLQTTGITNDNLKVTVNTTNPITSTGVFTLTLASDLLELSSFATGSGFPARDYNSGDPQWTLLSIEGTTNQIEVASEDGLLGNPTISLSTNIVGPASIQAGSLQIGNYLALNNPNAIYAFTGSDIWFIPEAGGQTRTSLPLALRDNAELRFYDTSAPPEYVSIKAPDIVALGTYDLVLPNEGPAEGQVLAAHSTGELYWAAAPTFPGTSIVNSIPKYITAGGGLGDTDIIVDVDENMSGVKSITAQNLTIASATSNTIGTTTGALVLQPAFGNDVQVVSNLQVRGGNALRCYNSGNTFYAGFAAFGVSASNIWQLPSADGGANAPLVTNGSLGLSFATLRYPSVDSVAGAVVQTNGSGQLALVPQRIAVFSATGAAVTPNYQVGVTMTYVSAGNYTAAFTPAFATSGYGAVGIAQNTAGSTFGLVSITARATGTCTVNVLVTGTPTDLDLITVVFYGS